MSNEVLEKYIEKWEAVEGIKPKNQKVFIDSFIEFINKLDDCSVFSFDGEGSYFGKQLSIRRDFFSEFDLSFEICFDEKTLSIYTGNHDGLWTPEYVLMSSRHKRFDELMGVIKNKFRWAFGL